MRFGRVERALPQWVGELFLIADDVSQEMYQNTLWAPQIQSFPYPLFALQPPKRCSSIYSRVNVRLVSNECSR